MIQSQPQQQPPQQQQQQQPVQMQQIPQQQQQQPVQMQQTPQMMQQPQPQIPVSSQQQQQQQQQQQIDDAFSQIMNPLHISIFKCQMHAYKLIARNQPLPENMLNALKSRVGAGIARPRMFF
jgi:hypothetical protein